MKKNFRHRGSLTQAQSEPDIMDLISKMQQQLASIENKIDALASQSFKNKSEGQRFPKPFQRFDRPRHDDRRPREDGFRDRSFTKVICSDCNKECEVPFKPSGDRPVYCKECFSKRKGANPFKEDHNNKPQETTFMPASHFPKQRNSAGKRPYKKRQPSPRRRK
ncbi:MAG: CxxC-x17-CxxC domain-containing protein [Candidatus Omnitrophota bacterium]